MNYIYSKWRKMNTEASRVPNPSFIGRWTLGKPMAREINPQYQKNDTK